MPKPYASLLVKLLQTHALYDDDRTYWSQLEQYEGAVKQYVETIGLDLVVNRTDGLAYLRPQPVEAGDDKPILLIRPSVLTYEQSLLCVLLREWLEEHELSNSLSSSRLFVTREQVRDRIELFFKNQPNRKALVGKLDSLIEKLVDIGFLKPTRRDDTNPDNTQYEVKTLLKAKLTNEKLEAFRDTLRGYVNP